jgi:hypothetical protein
VDRTGIPRRPETAQGRDNGVVRGPTDQRPVAPDFGRVGPEHSGVFLGIMSILHSESVAPAFGRLLRKRLEPDDYVVLAHLFEEISVLALHHLVPEALLFDAFGFDLYWDELREDIMELRQQTGNEKFCENFEIAAERALDYRNDRPPKRRWHHRPEDEDPPGPPREPGQGPPGLPQAPRERESRLQPEAGRRLR